MPDGEEISGEEEMSDGEEISGEEKMSGGEEMSRGEMASGDSFGVSNCGVDDGMGGFIVSGNVGV